MACYVKVKFVPMGLFGKKLLKNAISSRPSTCLSAHKYYDFGETRNSDILPFDYTNHNGNTVKYESSVQFAKRAHQKLNCCLPTNNDVQEMDRLEILNYFQTSPNINQNRGFRDSLQWLEATILQHAEIDLKIQEKPHSYIYHSSQNKNNKPEVLKYSQPDENNFGKKPSAEQLEKVFLGLSETLPRFFVDIHDYSLYNKDIVFKNAIRRVEIKGISAYAQHLSWLKLLGHFRYSRVKLKVLKITKHEEDSTIRVRWRITGVSGVKAMVYLFLTLSWKQLEKHEEWIDGFSIFYIGSDGLISKHVCDKMMPDDNRETVEPKNVGLKLATTMGIIPSATSLGNFSLCSINATTSAI